MRTFVFLLSIFSFALFPFPLRAETIGNLGFVNGSLWYEREPFFAGETVRVYSILANSTEYDLTASVVFYDNDVKIGQGAVNLSRFGGSQIVWVDWTPKEGNHSVSAKIEGALISRSGEAPRAVELASAATAPVAKFVDADIDHDKIGNATDTDDDNDKIPDKKDPQPLVANAAGDPYAKSSSVPSSKNSEGGINAKAVESVTTALGGVGSVLSNAVSDAAPKAVALAEGSFRTVEDWRVAQSERISEARDRSKAEIDTKAAEAAKNGEDGGTLWPDQAKNLALVFAAFAFGHATVFYPLLAVIFWYVIVRLGGLLIRRWYN